MDERTTSEMEKADKLEQVRSQKQQRLENEKFVHDRFLQEGDFRKFAKQGIAESKKRRQEKQDGYGKDSDKRQRRKLSRQIKDATDAAETGKAAITAFTEIDVSRDVSYFFVITISVLADIFSIVPILGSITAVLFAILIWLVYLISGHFKLKAAQQTTSLVIAVLFELIPGLNFLPFFTASAIINYWIALAARKAEKQKNAKNRPQEEI